MKKLCLFCLISMIGLVLFSPLRGQAATLNRIKVGYPSPSASFYPLFATKEAGLFEKYGLEVEMIYVQGVQLVQVHVAGQLDLSVISGVVFLQASVEGADLILVASSIDNQLMKVMAHPSISGPADLKGKTIAITRFGSLTDLVVRPVLTKWGLDPNKDVKLVQIGRMPDIATAIALRKVDGGVISFPTSLQAEKMGLKTLLDLADSGMDIPATTVAVSRKYSKSHRDLVMRFLKAYIEGTRRLLVDRELGIRALRKYGGVSDRELLATTYDLFTTKYIKKVPTIPPKGVENALSLIGETNPRAKDRKAGEFIDTSFMEELEKTGFIKSVWP
jgi:NitT/TauT family transport system substrate-binding protein